MLQEFDILPHSHHNRQHWDSNKQPSEPEERYTHDCTEYRTMLLARAIKYCINNPLLCT